MTSPAPVRLTANPSPVRRPGSIRRTSSIDVTWQGDMTTQRLFSGRARDIVRTADGEDRVRAEAVMEAGVAADRTITAMAATPAPEGLERLVGERGGGHLRGVLRDLFPGLIADAHPLYLLLDDISGTSLVSNWAWSQWGESWLEKMGAAEGTATMEEMLAARSNICWGFQPGFSSHQMESRDHHRDAADGKDLRNPADPAGWHDFPLHDGVSFRRARRIDVWREDGRIAVEASFQDSAPRSEGRGRAALHEYVLRLTADAASGVIESLDPEPRVLPFHECPGAIANAKGLIGTPIADVRASVLEKLRGPAGCTHLNDALRALAEVPQLLAALDVVEAPA